MRRSAVPFLLGILALGLIGLLVFAMARTGEGEDRRDTIDAQIQAGKVVAAPGLQRQLPRVGHDGTARIADYRGQVVVLNIWASWCQPCKAEAPLLERTHQALRKANAGTVLGVTNRDTPEDSVAFARRYGMTYPSLGDPGSKLATDYGALQVPETIVIDRQGRIRDLVRGEVDVAFLRRALGEAGVPAAGLPAR
ncbi:TlpA family protein disulfide reductase [Patulibacter defluvii]|uniref:TlpA family protein disulfide reductase n=1 Tax=Patulibacter defluvii TaxID=3095358 RepID=UPI002A74A0FB|nr:TlpA disulfide reductase family protein [Patulibacter sp. DM4]